MNNPVHILEILKKQFFGLKYLNFFMRILDGKKADTGSGINIPDPQNCEKHGCFVGTFSNEKPVVHRQLHTIKRF